MYLPLTTLTFLPGVRHCVKVEFIRVMRHHVDPGEAYSSIREGRMQKEMHLFHLRLLCISMGPHVWFVLNKLSVHHFKNLYSHRIKNKI